MSFRVVAVYKGLYKVFIEGDYKTLPTTGNMKKSGQFPVVGDLVELNNEREVITSILPRKTKLSRKVAGNEVIEQILASNIDYVFIVTSLNDDFNIARLERYLTFVYESGANPVFILTKSDVGEEVEEKITELEAISFGVPIFKVSIFNEESINSIKEYFEKEIIATLVGSSGVGKSSLINKLLGNEVLETSGIREDDAKGRHTTTHRELFFLEKGAIIDTPGMRELQFWGGDLSNSFEDVESLITKCKFNDCTHTNEPKCAIRTAILTGELLEERFERYKKLQKELKYIENKQNEGVKRAEKDKMIKMMGSLDARKNIKNKK